MNNHKLLEVSCTQLQPLQNKSTISYIEIFFLGIGLVFKKVQNHDLGMLQVLSGLILQCLH